MHFGLAKVNFLFAFEGNTTRHRRLMLVYFTDNVFSTARYFSKIIVLVRMLVLDSSTRNRSENCG